MNTPPKGPPPVLRTLLLGALVVVVALLLRAALSYTPSESLDTRFKAPPAAANALPAPPNPDKLKSLPGARTAGD